MIATAISEQRLSGYLWLYSNYHCNLACEYCLTESSPRVEPRLLGSERMIALTRAAAELEFECVGITGGEPFLLPDLPELLIEMAQLLPVTVLTNGTLFNPRLLSRLRPLADLPVSLQVSLDSADPERNDRYRGPGNFSTVVATIPKLLSAGLKVRLATTGGDEDPTVKQSLCDLHKKLGISDDDHVIRPTVHRGRAVDHGLGVEANLDNLPPELTITADGAFWSPFAPTVHHGRLDTDLLISRTLVPLHRPAQDLINLITGRPAGADAQEGIR